MKFNIYVTLKGPGGLVEAPNDKNPVECANLASLLVRFGENLPVFGFGVEMVGLRIEQIGTTESAQ